MTWLSEIEAGNVGYRKVMRLSDKETDKERMARVIRVLAGVVKAYENNERLMYRLIRNLSPDAKEVIDDTTSPSST